ncbi:MAG: hypothetical protein KA821_13010 [Chitinophagaceae bacterium]|nr:hypothetical protein [Chitinophagaceae bacterium]
MFTYNVQLAGYGFGQADDKGAIDLDEFLHFVQNFPWVEQLRRYQTIREGASATVSAVDILKNTILWISIAGTEKKPIYLVGYVYMKPVKKFWMPGKIRLKKWVDIFSFYTLDDTIPLFKLFFGGEDEKLAAALSTKEKFDSMPAAEY